MALISVVLKSNLSVLHVFIFMRINDDDDDDSFRHTKTDEV